LGLFIVGHMLERHIILVHRHHSPMLVDVDRMVAVLVVEQMVLVEAYHLAVDHKLVGHRMVAVLVALVERHIQVVVRMVVVRMVVVHMVVDHMALAVDCSFDKLEHHKSLQ